MFVLMLIFGFSFSTSAQNKNALDSKVYNFRKNYGKELSYHYSGDFKYTQLYLDDLYLVTEYYIATSENELVKLLVSNKEKIEYSVEQQFRNEKEYTVLGIGTVVEGRVTKVQWLYYDAENKVLYEYDLPNDELVEYN